MSQSIRRNIRYAIGQDRSDVAERLALSGEQSMAHAVQRTDSLYKNIYLLLAVCKSDGNSHL